MDALMEAVMSGEPPKVLICGFGPFPSVPRNPSEAAARQFGALRRPALAHLSRSVEILPTRWDALALLEARITALRPDVVLLLGVAGRRSRIEVETRAVNAASAAPDADGRHAPARQIEDSGPPERVSHLPVQALVAALRRAGLAAGPSRDAGRYLCNAAYYTALRAVGNGGKVVFVHLPGRGARVDPARRAHGLAGLLRALLKA